jgi:hypothetical protein
LNQQLDVVAKSIFIVNREYGLFESELKIEINDIEDNLDLFVWIKIDGKRFYKIVNENGKSGIISMKGQLVGQIPFYSTDIEVIIDIDLDIDEPAQVTKILCDGNLKKDFEKGISSERLIEMLTNLYLTKISEIKMK